MRGGFRLRRSIMSSADFRAFKGDLREMMEGLSEGVILNAQGDAKDALYRAIDIADGEANGSRLDLEEALGDFEVACQDIIGNLKILMGQAERLMERL